jgi:hypothetical protein
MDSKPHKPYPSDLTDAQWALIEPLSPPPARRGRGLLGRRIFMTGCVLSPEAAGKEPQPSAGSIDSQAVKATRTDGERGYDAGKKNQRGQAARSGGHIWVVAGRRRSPGKHPRP